MPTSITTLIVSLSPVSFRPFNHPNHLPPPAQPETFAIESENKGTLLSVKYEQKIYKYITVHYVNFNDLQSKHLKVRITYKQTKSVAMQTSEKLPSLPQFK